MIIFLCFFLGILSIHANFVDIFIRSYPPIRYHNVSLGLHSGEQGHYCPTPLNSNVKMKYSANRRLQNETNEESSKGQTQLGFILALGGHNNTHYDYGRYGSLNGLLAIWDSWVDNFFSQTSNSSSLVLLFDERDYLRLKIAGSHREYLDTILVKNMGAHPVNCVHYKRKETSLEQHLENHAYHSTDHSENRHNRVTDRMIDRFLLRGCSNELTLDQSYRVYYIDSFLNSSNSQRPLIIFAAVHTFPKPDWAKDVDEEHLFTHWRPARMGRFKTNYGYVKMTNWYSYHMLNLKLLDFFDYAGKLDNDVSFVKPFPEPNLPHLMVQNGASMLVTQDKWYFDEPRVAQGIRQCLNMFIEEEKSFCLKKYKSHNQFELIPSGLDSHSIFWESNMNATFRAHFLVFWLGIYTSPETRMLAKYWNDWNPRGMWDYRWGDQQWWPRPLAMFSEKSLQQDIFHYSIIDTDNEHYVVHKEWPRFGTLMKTNYFDVDGMTKEERSRRYKVASKSFIY